jgi:hypothetical protein
MVLKVKKKNENKITTTTTSLLMLCVMFINFLDADVQHSVDIGREALDRTFLLFYVLDNFGISK